MGEPPHRGIDLRHRLTNSRPQLGGNSRKLISFVKDRPGHDRRYAIDAAKIQRELGWTPAHKFEDGIRETVRWYLDNQAWVKAVVEKINA